MRLNREQLELILEIIDRGNFSAAARALNRVPSAVSMAIANLEAELNLKLFERSKNHLEPTEVALSIEPHARLIVTKMRQLDMHLTELSTGLETRISIGIAADMNQRYLLAGVEQLIQLYPLLNIEMVCAPQQELKARLQNNEIDLYVAYSSSELDKNERFRLLGVEKFVAAISPKDAQQLKDHDKNELTMLSELRQIIVASKHYPLPDRRVLVSDAYWYSDNLAMAINMVEQGMGWGNFPLSIVSEHFSKHSLIRLEFSDTTNGLDMPIHAIWPSYKPLSKTLQRLIQLWEKQI
ncbi:LysR family transcriptional regulator [Acinetobacter venetianus]|uniref:LysR family transcriptional regulator n=1 Tax=Acinetobacter venetianus TaxID=52133 RepID=UPI0021501024|nr:LysR family transcriptional regulator [Acinetobacter venetianus]MCR4529645.1 LysR family transcriptional regulator [Acinetobacter venetianus]MDA0695231.1 LysR family transcriptional regulator [Pseudomonadota bacterium]MDA1252868.1 LysR family transcriptional regulator [Pseudomonadota bacterium]